jgi:REP element-mobilizing transposase RayT
VSSEKTRNPGTRNDASGTGVPPVTSFQTTRRNLPHFQDPGSVYFLTWRVREGQTLAPAERTLVMQALRHWNGSKWALMAAVVMPDHVHALVRPLASPAGGVFALAEIVHSVKSFSAHQIRRRRGNRGPLWQDERYDRMVRDEAEFLEKWNYIRNNAGKAGLAPQPEDYPWLYEKR